MVLHIPPSCVIIDKKCQSSFPPWIINHVSHVFSGINLLWSHFRLSHVSVRATWGLIVSSVNVWLAAGRLFYFVGVITSCSLTKVVITLYIFLHLICRPTLWEKSHLWSKSMQKRWHLWRSAQRLCLSLSRRLRGPLLRLESQQRLHVICMSGGKHLQCRGACEDFISLICFISVGHKQEMAHAN